jgi:1,4-dihydroxy-2-naphthoyl-CoA hydrolase
MKTMCPASGFVPVRTATGSWTIEEIRRMPLSGFQHVLGHELRLVEPELIVADLRTRPEHLNSVGTIHGGVLMAFADCLGAMGAVQHLAPSQRTATLESKANFIGAACGNTISGRCIPIHIGRRTSVWNTIITDCDGRLLASVTQTQMNLENAD